MGLFQIFADRERLGEPVLAVDQHGNESLRVQRQMLRRMLVSAQKVHEVGS